MLTQRINLYYDQLTDTDKHVIKVLSTPHYITPKLTIKEVAKKANVSTTSVHRALKKLHYASFAELKYETLNRDIAQKEITSYTSIVDVITQTINIFEQKDHQELFQKLHEAQTIYGYGTGTEQLDALKTFSNHFMYYERPLTLLPTQTDLEIKAKKMTANDLLIIVSLNGGIIDYQDTLQSLKLRNVSVLSITQNIKNDLASFADYRLYFENDFHHGLISLHFPALTLNVLLDALIYHYLNYKNIHPNLY